MRKCDYMKKKLIVFVVLFSLFLMPIKANALEINFDNNLIQIGAKNTTTNNNNNPDTWDDGFNQDQTCNGDNSILGSVNDTNSVAWLLQQIFNYIKILGPILVVVLSSVEFAKVIINSDDEAMAKAQKKLITRIILAACLFLIPTLVSAALDIFGLTSDATCGLE